MKKNDKNLIVLKHPLMLHYFSILRDKNTDSENFRNALKKISEFLFIEASKNVPTQDKEIYTPLEKTIAKTIDQTCEFIAVPILRAGLIFEDLFLKYLPMATVAHIGMCRDEKTLKPCWYLDKTKKCYNDCDKKLVYILDPMLATGNSGKSVIELFVQKGIPEENITFVSLIAAPEGIENIFATFPNVKIITGALDRELNQNGYILPGLGDAGDRIFNTVD